MTQLTLTPLQIALLQHPDCLTDLPKAAMDVGYSESMAHSSKLRAFRDEHLPELVERMRERLEQLAITPHWVKNEIAILARTAPSDFLTFVEDQKTGDQYTVLKPRSEIPDDKWRSAIKEVKFDTYIDAQGKLRSRVSEIKFYDRQKALLDLATLLGLTSEKVLEAEALARSSVQTEEQRMLEAMEPEELEEIARIHERVRERVTKKASNKRDRRAIPAPKDVESD